MAQHEALRNDHPHHHLHQDHHHHLQSDDSSFASSTLTRTSSIESTTKQGSSSNSSSTMDSSVSSSSPPSSPSPDGPLYQFSDLIAKLPIKRGLSNYYDGKSQSFTSLASVTCLADLPKKEHPYNRRMKLSRTYGGGRSGLDAHNNNNNSNHNQLNHHQRFCTPKPTIAKKATTTTTTVSSGSSSRSSCLSAMGRNSDLFLSCCSRQPTTIAHLQRQN